MEEFLNKIGLTHLWQRLKLIFALKSELPTKVSDLTNDSGYITGYTETDPTVPSWAKQNSKPTYTASEVGALPATTPIPSKTSDLTNDSGFLTTETDPTVPSWAKAGSKPTYTASEVGALPNNTTYVSGVKGNAESSYRSGQVNLTPANIGAQDDVGLYIDAQGYLCQRIGSDT